MGSDGTTLLAFVLTQMATESPCGRYQLRPGVVALIQPITALKIVAAWV